MTCIRSIARNVGAAVVVASLAWGCETASRAERNIEIVRRMTDAINDRDLGALDALVAPDLRRHSGATPDLVVESRDDFKEFLRSDFAAVPDSKQDIELIFANDEFVGARVLYRGTQQGAWGPFPASGKRLELPFVGLLRIEDDRVAEIWVEWDNLNALTQLGHVPSASESDAKRAAVESLPTPSDGSGLVFIPSDTLLPCHVRAPAAFDPEHSYDLVIGLHGFGSSPDKFASISTPFVEAGMLFAAPQAPTPFLLNDRLGFDWDQTHVDQQDRNIEEAFERTAVYYIIDVVSELKHRYRIDHVYLMGFSQGGAYAYVVGIHRPDIISGVAVVGMGLSADWFEEGALENGSQLPILIAHSRDDDRIAFDWVQSSADELRALGYDVTMVEYKGGHRITDDVLQRMVQWLQNR